MGVMCDIRVQTGRLRHISMERVQCEFISGMVITRFTNVPGISCCISVLGSARFPVWKLIIISSCSFACDVISTTTTRRCGPRRDARYCSSRLDMTWPRSNCVLCLTLPKPTRHDRRNTTSTSTCTATAPAQHLPTPNLTYAHHNCLYLSTTPSLASAWHATMLLRRYPRSLWLFFVIVLNCVFLVNAQKPEVAISTFRNFPSRLFFFDDSTVRSVSNHYITMLTGCRRVCFTSIRLRVSCTSRKMKEKNGNLQLESQKVKRQC